MERSRLERFWWGAMAVDVVSVGVAVVAQLPSVQVSWWALVVLLVLMVAALAVVATTWPRPFPGAGSSRFGEQVRFEATRQVGKGEPVEPPGLEAEALGSARRGLWAGLMIAGFWPLVGLSFVFQDTPGPFAFLPAVGVVFIVGGAVVLVVTRVSSRKVVAVEARRQVGPFDPSGPGPARPGMGGDSR